jgi:hypothetical protein
MENKKEREDGQTPLPLLKESRYQVWWPHSSEVKDAPCSFTQIFEAEHIAKIEIGKNIYQSDIYLNAAVNGTVCFNIGDVAGKKLNEGETLHLLGDILFIDKDNNNIILKEEDMFRLHDILFYAPGNMYLSIDLSNGNILFENSDITDLQIQYLAFFLVTEKDFKAISSEINPGPLSKEEKNALIEKSVAGYNSFTDEQKKQINDILENHLFSDENAKIKQLKEDIEPHPEIGGGPPARFKVPLNEDGSVNISLFVNQICPAYAEQKINWSAVIFDPHKPYLPEVNEDDIRNLSLIGFSPKDMRITIDSTRELLIEAYNKIELIKKEIEGMTESYNAVIEQCSNEITQTDFDNTKQLPVIAENYEILSGMIDKKNTLKYNEELFKLSQDNLAVFQTVSRDNIKKAVENGVFINKASLSAVTVFYHAMLKNGIANSEFPEKNYSVYNTYLKFLNTYYTKLNSDSQYFSDMFLNSLYSPAKEPSLFSLFSEILQRTIRINDIADLPKDKTYDIIMSRVNDRIQYFYSIAYYPAAVVSRICKEFISLLSFSIPEEELKEFQINNDKVLAKFKEKGWPLDGGYAVENLIAKIEKFHNILDDPDNFELIIGFLFMARNTVYEEFIAKIKNKRVKNNTEAFKIFINYSILMQMTKYIDVLISGKADTQDESTGEIKKITLTQDNLKANLGKFLIELASVSIFMGSTLRLNYLIENSIEDAKTSAAERDVGMLFSIIVNGVIIPIQVADSAKDKNSEENAVELDSIIPIEQKRFLGEEAAKVFYNGLKGGESLDESGNYRESKLLAGRKEIIANSVTFVENVFDTVNTFIEKHIIPNN